MALSNLACKQAKAQKKDYRITDSGGLYLLVKANGTKCWRMDYRIAGRRKTAAFGVYPDVSLEQARAKRQAIRSKLADGIDPAAAMREEKLLRGFDLDATFEAVAREWHGKKTWTPRYAKQVMKLLERDFFPAIGLLPVKNVTPPLLLAALRKIEKRDALDMLEDAQSIAGQIFRYAIATGRAERDVAADLRGAFKRHVPEHHRSLREDQFPAFLKALEAFPPGLGRNGLKLVLLTLARTTEVRAAKWSEFNVEKALWVIPAERMKMRREHVIPLSRQAVEFLTALKGGINDDDSYLFPIKKRAKPKKKPIMSENTMLKVIKDLGYKDLMTTHGIRATASTILHESGKFDSLVIERQLAHKDKNKVRGAYNHAPYMKQRQEMMQWWADYLDQVRCAVPEPRTPE